MNETLQKDVKVLLEFHEFNLTKEQIEEFFNIFKENKFFALFSIVDINEQPSKMRLYLMKKSGKKIGFLNYDLETLAKVLMCSWGVVQEGTCSGLIIIFAIISFTNPT
jgi:hypothetical protein